MTLVRISNTRLWQLAEEGEDIEEWLNDNAGLRNWHERYGINPLPYRCFVIDDDQIATLFAIKWL